MVAIKVNSRWPPVVDSAQQRPQVLDEFTHGVFGRRDQSLGNSLVGAEWPQAYAGPPLGSFPPRGETRCRKSAVSVEDDLPDLNNDVIDRALASRDAAELRIGNHPAQCLCQKPATARRPVAPIVSPVENTERLVLAQ